MRKQIEITPCFSRPYEPDSGSSYMKQESHFFCGYTTPRRKNSSYLFFIQFCKMILFTRLGFISSSSFFLHVLHVIGLGAHKHMIGIDTRGIVTMMTEKQPPRNWLAKQFPCISMGSDSQFVRTKNTIAQFVFNTLPFPTFSFYVDLNKTQEFPKNTMGL